METSSNKEEGRRRNDLKHHHHKHTAARWHGGMPAASDIVAKASLRRTRQAW